MDWFDEGVEITDRTPKIVILEGISGCGKSTLLHAVNSLTDYRDPVLMRFTPSCWVYNRVNERPEVDYEPINQALMSTADVHVVWLDCPPDEALRRKLAQGDDRLEDLVRAAWTFADYFDNVCTFKHVHRIDAGVSLGEILTEIKAVVYPC